MLIAGLFDRWDKEDEMTSPRIVVGVDGSSESTHALRWALAEARLRGAAVEVVHAWHYPAWTYSPAILSTPVFAREDLEVEAKAVLDGTVDGVLAEEAEPPALDRVVVEGPAAEELVRRSEKAELLVVGHRGRGGFAGLLLGSVAHQCSAHATCPVVVVR
jgi:nucleotide-binding universal stress UspA family protein